MNPDIKQGSLEDRIHAVHGKLADQASATRALSDVLSKTDDGDLVGLSDLLGNIADKLFIASEELDCIFLDVAAAVSPSGNSKGGA